MPDRSAGTRRSERTRRHILRSAERVFADRGFRAMTLREVTRHARVNLAAVNYHFGSKQALIRAVMRRHFEPVNAARLRLLEQAVAVHHPAPAPVETIFAALFRPVFDTALREGADGRRLSAIIGRALTEPAEFLRGIHREFFAELGTRFLAELRRTFPGMPESELQYRFFLAVSTMLGALLEQIRLDNLSGGRVDAADPDLLCEQLVRFTAAGFGRGMAGAAANA